MGCNGLRAGFRRAGDAGELVLEGDLDIATAPLLTAALTDALEAVPALSEVIVDLDGVRFCGVRGLTVLLDAADRVTGTGGRLVLARCTPHMRRLMDLVGVARRPHPVSTDPGAVELLPRPGVPGPSPALR